MNIKMDLLSFQCLSYVLLPYPLKIQYIYTLINMHLSKWSQITLNKLKRFTIVHLVFKDTLVQPAVKNPEKKNKNKYQLSCDQQRAERHQKLPNKEVTKIHVGCGSMFKFVIHWKHLLNFFKWCRQQRVPPSMEQPVGEWDEHKATGTKRIF